MSRIIACSLSRCADPRQPKIWKSIRDLNENNSNKIELKLKHNNTKVGLPEYYNECIDTYASDYDYMVLVHDDVEFINMDLGYQIEQGMKNFDVLGVAGCVNPKIGEMNLWHIMSQKPDQRGFAGHPFSDHKPEEFYVTSFGPVPSRVALIDGVVMIIKCAKILETDTRFDINFRFHHYDMDFSLECNKNKLRIGVWPILINHSSPGLRNITEDWKQSNERFKNKWTKTNH